VLQGISDGWSNAVSLVYSNNLLVSVEHSNGQSLDFAYSSGLLSAVTAATNLNLSFTYNGNGSLTGVVQQTGSEPFAESYSYDSSLLLTQRVDSVGNNYHYSYDAAGKATGMYLTEGGQWYHHQVSYTGTTNSQVTYYRNGEFLVHRYKINPFINRILEEQFENTTGRVAYAYDGPANVVRKTTYAVDEERWIWMQNYRRYDKQHNITNEAFRLHYELFDMTNPDSTPANITRYTWHPQWQTLTSMTDPEGFKAEYEYTNGAVALERIWLSSDQTAETKYSYTTNGLLSAITNANGHSTAFTYDDRGYPESVIPQVGPVMTFGFDSLGHLTNSALPGGRETGYTVNPLGWVERIDYADTLYETFQYNGLGDVTNHVDRAERVASYAYAPGGKLTGVTRQLGSTNVTVSYDFDQQFNTLAIKDELNRPVESYGLDPLDRPTTVTNVENQTMSIRYLVGDFVDSITRFDNTVVSNEYTGDGRLEAVHYPDETNRYTYLRNGLVRTLENSGGIISNGWNHAVWLTQTVSSASSVTSAVNYSYDPIGNVTNTVVSIGSQQIGNSYAYDEAERLTNMVTETQGFVYSYNTNNGLVAAMLCTNTGVQAEYDYDLLDRIRYITWKDSWGATLLSFDYQYNAAGMITNVVKNGGSPVSYQYDDLDRLTGVTTDSGLVEYGYDFAGNRQTKTVADYAVSYALGDGNRLASWSATSTNDFLSKRTLRVQGYSSEAIGTDNRWGQLYVSNSVTVAPTVNGTNFSIDAFTVGMGTQTVVAAIRDQAGNMGYATNEFFLSVVTNGAYAYNAAGCLTNISYAGAEYSSSTALRWNGQYQLTSVSSAYSVVNYSYDVLGRRSSRTVAGGGDPGSTNTEFYVYTGNQVVADLDEPGQLIRSYVWGPGIDNLLSMTVYGTEETNTYYALTDHLNTVHALIDTSGQIVERYEYDAWGRVLGVYDASGAELAQSAIGNRYLWQGREYDFETGLYYFRARWYDPVVGRWLSNDLIGISGGLNQYVFCGNNPRNFIDPLGLKVGDWWDYPANVEFNAKVAAAQAFSEARDSGLPGASSGPQDAYRHTRWNQIMAQDMGKVNAFLASAYHELVHNVKDGTQNWNDFRMDMHNNLTGVLSSKNPIDLLNNGQLKVNTIAPQSGYKCNK
jgi:RHS repeat-associated protein